MPKQCCAKPGQRGKGGHREPADAPRSSLLHFKHRSRRRAGQETGSLVNVIAIYEEGDQLRVRVE